MTRPARSDLVSHGDPAPALDENHVRRLPSTFWCVDDPFRGISELDTRSLRRYGAFDPVAGVEITALSADLQNLMPRDKGAGRGAEGGRPRTPHIPQNAR